MKQLASLTAIAAFAISGMVSGAVAPAIAADGPTLTAVKKRGELICGVHQGRYGFAIADKKGKWKGLDVDVCKAVAAAYNASLLFNPAKSICCRVRQPSP